MNVEVVSPEKILFSGQASMVTAGAADGDIAFLEGHAPFIGTLRPGVVKIRNDAGADLYAAVHGGFVEVSDNRVTILTDVAELANDIDKDRAEKAVSAAKSALAESSDGAHRHQHEAALRRAEVRLAAAAEASIIHSK